MIKEMKGWKIITSDRKSYKASNWGLDGKKWSVNYPVGVEVKPKVEGTKLFFFKNREDAVLFMKIGFPELIVPCIAKNVTRPKYVGNYVHSIREFWDLKNGHRSTFSAATNAPTGTYLAESITCLE